MRVAFVDSSCVMAMQFGEASARDVQRRFDGFDTLHVADLLEAEVAAACRRAGVLPNERLLGGVRRVPVLRSLRPEIDRVLAAGYVRGADCLHLATALHLSPDPTELTFLTLDTTQRAVAEALGFPV